MAVIKIALKQCGMTHAVITSTIRDIDEQLRIMYANAKKNIQSQYDLYGSGGEAVLDVFVANKTKPKDEVIKLMTEKAYKLPESGLRISKHVVSKKQYLKENIIDIGVASTKKVCKNFNAKKFTKALNSLVKEGYINTFYDETKKPNKSWHIEITPGKKPLVEDIDASILSITRWC